MRKLISALVAATLVLAACGDDEPEAVDTAAASDAAPSDGDPTEAPFPVTVGSGDHAVTVEARPERIVSLSPSLTEILFAIDAGEQVVAVDNQSDHPPEAPLEPGLSGYEPSVEAIVTYDPDLVVVSSDPGDLVAGLDAVGIPTLLLPAPATLEDSFAQMEQLGAATGHLGDAAELVSGMQADIDELVAGLPERTEPLTYYHELDDTLYSITSTTFIGQIYELAGLVSIADAADPGGEAGGYPPLSAEFLLGSDPDLIFLADTVCCAQSAETLAQRPGFSELSALAEGRVVELDDDIASRWGPRVVDLLEAIVDATSQVPVS